MDLNSVMSESQLKSCYKHGFTVCLSISPRLKTEEKQRQDIAREELRQHRAAVMQQRALAEIKKPVSTY